MFFLLGVYQPERAPRAGALRPHFECCEDRAFRFSDLIRFEQRVSEIFPDLAVARVGLMSLPEKRDGFRVALPARKRQTALVEIAGKLAVAPCSRSRLKLERDLLKAQLISGD